MLGRTQIKSAIKRIQEVMDSQEISLLNHMEELKQREAREQLSKLKKLKEETKQILKEPGNSEQRRDKMGQNSRSVEHAKRPRSAGRMTGQATALSGQAQSNQMHAQLANLKNRQDIYVSALNQLAATFSSSK